MRLLILTLLNLIFDVCYLLFIIRIFLLYLPQNRYTKFLKPIYNITEPLLSWIRKGVPPASMGFDAAPFIAMVLLYMLQQVLLKVISLF